MVRMHLQHAQVWHHIHHQPTVAQQHRQDSCTAWERGKRGAVHVWGGWTSYYTGLRAGGRQVARRPPAAPILLWLLLAGTALLHAHSSLTRSDRQHQHRPVIEVPGFRLRWGGDVGAHSSWGRCHKPAGLDPARRWPLMKAPPGRLLCRRGQRRQRSTRSACTSRAGQQHKRGDRQMLYRFCPTFQGAPFGRSRG